MAQTDHQIMWSDIERNALSQLKEKQNNCLFYLAEMPSFSDHMVWVISSPKRDVYEANCQIWKRSIDAGRIDNPIKIAQEKIRGEMLPTLSSRKVSIPESWINEKLIQMSKLCFSIPSKANIGLDGCSYILGINVGMDKITLNWWEQGPDGWSDIISWFKLCWRELEQF